MLWYQYAPPVAMIALLVRLEAIFVGPYWAWLELVPDPHVGHDDSRQRRLALARRVSIPAIVGFWLVQLWERVYTTTNTVWIGASAGLLLLYPLVNGVPWYMRSNDLETIGLYGSLIPIFGASSYIGATIANWIRSDYGSLKSFAREEAAGVFVSSIVVLFSGTIFERISSRRSQDPDE